MPLCDQAISCALGGQLNVNVLKCADEAAAPTVNTHTYISVGLIALEKVGLKAVSVFNVIWQSRRGV